VMASTEPLRISLPSRFTPDIRVCAVKGTNTASCEASSRPRRLYCSFASTTIERPSGVSSASEESWAASAISAAVIPGAGMNSAAWRFPSVIVPVLSSSNVFTSPAASTAPPDIASTLCCTSRSMPAMPIAESRPPIVVGMRHTSSATSTGSDTEVPPYSANGYRLTHTSMKIIVSPASRILSAISLGVLWRWAPSTRPIMRSRKVSPGFAVMRTLIQSEMTVVPPVTALRSPPLSRITGADSPVIAASLTAATPSITSPSPGITSPALTNTMSSRRSEVAGTIISRPSLICRAWVSVRVLRRLSAWALPRPSAIASAKLANPTVNHSHIAICNSKTASEVRPSHASRARISVSAKAVTSTTNMTGLRAWRRGSNLPSESISAPLTILPSQRGLALRSAIDVFRYLVKLAVHHHQMLDDWSQRVGREEGEGGDDQDDADQQHHENRAVGGESARTGRDGFFPDEGASEREHGNFHHEATEQHHEPERRIVKGRICIQAAEGRTIVRRCFRVGVQNLR